jgi:hypothetical protein
MTDWTYPGFDEEAAHAVALVTLYLDASAPAAELARHLVEELTSRSDGTARTVGGIVALCGALLALHEFDTGLLPEAVLQRAAVAVQQALPS